MLGRIQQESPAFVRLTQDSTKNTCQCFVIPVWKGNTAEADRLGQTPAAGTDRDAPACDSFQRHDSKWLIVARGNDENLVSVKNFRERCAAFRTSEGDLIADAQVSRHFLHGGQFGTCAHNRQTRQQSLRTESSERRQQNVESFFGDKTAYKYQVAGPFRSKRAVGEKTRVVRIRDDCRAGLETVRDKPADCDTSHTIDHS